MFAEDQTDSQMKKFKAGDWGWGESNEIMSTQINALKFWPKVWSPMFRNRSWCSKCEDKL